MINNEKIELEQLNGRIKRHFTIENEILYSKVGIRERFNSKEYSLLEFSNRTAENKWHGDWPALATAILNLFLSIIMFFFSNPSFYLKMISLPPLLISIYFFYDFFFSNSASFTLVRSTHPLPKEKIVKSYLGIRFGSPRSHEDRIKLDSFIDAIKTKKHEILLKSYTEFDRDKTYLSQYQSLVGYFRDGEITRSELELYLDELKELFRTPTSI